MSGKILVLELWFKMFLTNQIAWFFDHQYIWKELSNIFDFLHRDKSSREDIIQDQFWLGVEILIMDVSEKNQLIS